MPERVSFLKTERNVISESVEYVCDSCGKGAMERVGSSILTDGVLQYPHECPVCGAKDYFIYSYPATRFRKSS